MTRTISIGSSLAWMTGSQLMGVALQFCAQVVLARILSLYETGIYAIAMAVVGFLAVLQSIGLQAFIIREKSLTPAILATAFTVNLGMSVLVGLIIGLLGFAGAGFLGDPGVGHVLYVMAFVPLIGAMAFQPLALLERDGHFRTIAVAMASGNVMGALATIVAALAGLSYMSAAFGQLMMACVQTLVLLFVGRHLPRPRLGLQRWREVMDFAMQMLAISGVCALGMRLSDVILGRLLGLSALGLYSRANGLNILIWSNLHLLAGRVLFVDFADAFRRGESLRERYVATVNVLTAVLWPIFAGFAILAGPFIALVFGDKWVPARGALCFLALSSIIQISITMTNELFAATDKLRVQTRIEFIRAGFSLTVFVIGAMVSIEAAAAARAVESVFAVMIYRRHIHRMTDTGPADINPIYLRSAFLTVMTCLPPLLASLYWHWSPHMPMPWVFSSIALGSGLWFCLIIVMRHPIWIAALRTYRTRTAPAAAVLDD